MGPGFRRDAVNVEASAQRTRRLCSYLCKKRGERFGDEIDITRSDGKMFRYRADASSVVRLDSSDIDPLSHGHELVLPACWPFDVLAAGPERYLLHATMIAPAA
jgi:sortase A